MSGCYISFLVRFYCDTGPGPSGPSPDWHGEVEHIQTGQRQQLDSLEEVFKYLRQQLAAAEAKQT